MARSSGDNDPGANSWTVSDKEALERNEARVRDFPFPGKHVMPSAEVIAKIFVWLEEDWNESGKQEQLKKMNEARTPAR